MDNSSNMLQLCRLCLVKDDVNIPIFEEQGDIRQIFLKISSCLPVKVSQDDRLPKKICDGCSYKLDMLYEFWNSSANAEKQLLTWLGEAGMTSQMTDGTISAVAQQIKPADALVKQETIDPPDINHSDDDEDDDKTYMFNKQEEKVSKNNIDEPPPKRQRRTAAVKAAIAMDQNSDDDDDSGEPMTKMEDDSDDSDNDDHEPAFVDVPSTSADDQPGPSGMGKDGVDAPQYYLECGAASNTLKNRRCIWKQFSDFCRDRNYRLTSAIETKQLADILEDWAKNMKKHDGTDYKERAIKTIWNVTAKVLQAMYLKEFNRRFNPFTDELFAAARDAKVNKMRELSYYPLKRQQGADVFSVTEYRKMLESCDENSPEGLQKKFFLIASYELFWRGGEGRKCKIHNFKERVLSNCTFIEYNQTFNRTNQENMKAFRESKYLFENLDQPSYCPVRLYRKLRDKRPDYCKTDQFFLVTNRNRLGNVARSWFNNQGAGKNQMGAWTKQIAENIGINTSIRKVTNHSPKMSAMLHLTINGFMEDEINKMISGRLTFFPYDNANIRQYERLIGSLRYQLSEDFRTIRNFPNSFNFDFKNYRIILPRTEIKTEIIE